MQVNNFETMYMVHSTVANTSLWRGEGLRAQIQGTHGSPGQPLCSSLFKVSVGRYHSTLVSPCRKPTTSNSKLLDHHEFPSKYGKSLGWFLALPRETIINAGSTWIHNNRRSHGKLYTICRILSIIPSRAYNSNAVAAVMFSYCGSPSNFVGIGQTRMTFLSPRERS